MDYFANGYLKKMIKKRRCRSGSGLIKVAREEWGKIPLEMFQKALTSWSSGLMLFRELRGIK